MSKAPALATSFFFATTCNAMLFRAVTGDRSWADSGAWTFGGAMLTMLSAGHLVSLRLVLQLVLLWRVRVSQWTLMRATVVCAATLAAALALLVGSALRLFQDFSARMRNQKDLRYPIAPGNSLYSGVRVLAADRRQAMKPHVVVGADARFADSRAAWTRPLRCAA